jgi:transposase
MAAMRIAMRKIHEVLRLHFLGHLKQRAIARSVKCSRPAVADYLARTAKAGIASWEQVQALDEAQLERLLFSQGRPEKTGSRSPPDWNAMHAELKRPGVTRELLWQEYKQEFPDGYQRSQFNALYAVWKKKLDPVMRQEHRAGEKMFVDYCDGLALTDRLTGEPIPTQLFVAALGASSCTFAEATRTQQLPDWLASHVHAFEFYGGVTALIIPDNLKSGVNKPCRYEAEINPSYRDLAEHYGACVIPARARKPRDKAKAEAAVLVAQRWILAALRNRTFYELGELNVAIRELLEKINNRPLRHVGKSRRELFETIDRPALKALPPTRYEFAEFRKATVNIDYHVAFGDHFYSAPYALIHEVVELRVTAKTIEILHKGRRIDSHVRSFLKGKYSTKSEHMPRAHREHAEWTPSRIVQWTATIGPAAAALVAAMLAAKAHPEQAYRSALGVIRLAKTHGAERAEKAAARAVALGSPSYRTVKNILANGLESAPVPQGVESRPELPSESALENVRGTAYYN